MEFVAAAVGIADVAARASSKAWKLCDLWRDAPRDIFLLRDELDRSTRFFVVLHNGVSGYKETPGSAVNPAVKANEELIGLLVQGYGVIERLQQVIDGLISVNDNGKPNGDITVDKGVGTINVRKSRKLLWLKHLNEVKKLKSSLSRVTNQICFQLAYLNLIISAELPAAIRESEARVGDRLGNTIHESAQDVVRVVEQSSSKIETHTAAATVALAATNKALEHQSDASQLAFTQIQNVLVSQDRQLQDMRTAINKISDSFLALNHQGSWAGPLSGTSPNVHLPSTLSRCSPSCKCRCHGSKHTWRWSFQGLHQALGSFTASYSGMPAQPIRCTDPSCRSGGGRSRMVVRYKLPEWAGRAMISLLYSRQPEPELVIRVHRFVPDDRVSVSGSLFGCLYRDSLDRIKDVLRARPSAVREIRGESRISVLNAALEKHDVPLCALLIQAGADPLHETALGLSPVHFAFVDTLKGRFPPGAFEGVMNFSEYLEDGEYGDLHRVAAGIMRGPGDLAAALRTQPHWAGQVNVVTRYGLTPLHFAAMRGDARMVRVLLGAGAKVDPVELAGTTPLLLAAERADEDTMEALLEAGASPFQHDTHKITALHKVAANGKSSTRAHDLLVQYGLDVNVVQADNCTALSYSMFESNIASIEYLTSHGADINHRDWEGDVPLNDAINWCCYQGVKVLLGRGVDYRTVNDHGQGVLHIIAERADKQMMELISEAGMTGLDLDMVDKLGKTATDVFNERASDDVELRVTFQRLLGAVRKADTIVTAGKPTAAKEGSDAGSEDEFFDAPDESQ